MFDNLVESEPQGSDLKDRRKYFAVSSVVVGILFTTAVVVSIFAADYGLGNGRLDLVEMIAPVAPDPVEPEIREQRPMAPTKSTSQSQGPTRQINMARVDEPTIAPTNVSTTPNTAMARPNIDRFVPAGIDSNGGTPNGIGRETGSPSSPGSNLSDSISKNDGQNEPEDTSPPPVIVKKPEPKKTMISKGVLNGTAKDLPKPLYSAAARQVGAQGQVNVQVTIDETGRVISANAVSGHVMLRAQAERAARNARFSTTYLSDVPVKVTGVITYNFVK